MDIFAAPVYDMRAPQAVGLSTFPENSLIQIGAVSGDIHGFSSSNSVSQLFKIENFKMTGTENEKPLHDVAGHRSGARHCDYAPGSNVPVLCILNSRGQA